MLATDTQGRTWQVTPDLLIPVGHNADPDLLTAADLDALALPEEPVEDLTPEDYRDALCDAARDRWEEECCGQ